MITIVNGFLSFIVFTFLIILLDGFDFVINIEDKRVFCMVRMRGVEARDINSGKARYNGLYRNLNCKKILKYSALQAWQQKMNPLKRGGSVDG